MKAIEAKEISEKSRKLACLESNHDEIKYTLDCIKGEAENGLRHFVTYKLMSQTLVELKKLGYKVYSKIDKNLNPVYVIVW